jgi:hypothetical protein
MGDYDEIEYDSHHEAEKDEANMDEWMMPRYEWLVQLEIKPVIVVVKANNAEEAMLKAEQKHQLKYMNLDDLPRLESVAANIKGVTAEFAAVMDEIKQ